MTYSTLGIAAPKCVGVTEGAGDRRIQKQEVGTRFHNSFQSKSPNFFPPPPPPLPPPPPSPTPYTTFLLKIYLSIPIFFLKKDFCFKEINAKTRSTILRNKESKKKDVFLLYVNERSSIGIVNNQSKIRLLLLFWYVRLYEDQATFITSAKPKVLINR